MQDRANGQFAIKISMFKINRSLWLIITRIPRVTF